MSDAADVIELVLSQFHYEPPSTKRIYSSAFEIDLEGINYENTGDYQIYSSNMIIYNADVRYSMPDTCFKETIIVPEIKPFARKFNIKKLMSYNLQYSESQNFQIIDIVFYLVNGVNVHQSYNSLIKFYFIR